MKIRLFLALLFIPALGQASAYRQVDACFVLDTTGSMSAAIETAKEKIWFIANEIARAPSQPSLRVCLMAFRDRDDDYVTRLTSLTGDIDQVHANLLELEAGGGGDTPEAVHQALLETVLNGGWQSDDDTLRVMFLIGDAPPKHYPDEPQYPEIAKLARNAGIVINPVLIGGNPQAESSWRQIEASSSGELLHMDAVRSQTDLKTPMDQDLVALNAKLGQLLLPYGSADERSAIEQTQRDSEGLADGKVIERLDYGMASGRVVHRSGDLLQDLDDGRVGLDELTPEHLPPRLRSMTREEITRSLGEIRAEREQLRTLIAALLAERRALVEAARDKASFEYQLSQVLLRQL